MKLNKLIAASLLVTGMGVSASASAIDITLCDAAGNPFCDGFTLNIDGVNLTGTAAVGGCYVGSGSGGVAYQIGLGGAGVSLGWSTDSTYATSGVGSTEVALSTQTWRHIDLAGNTLNSGVVCFMPAAAGAAGGSAD